MIKQKIRLTFISDSDSVVEGVRVCGCAGVRVCGWPEEPNLLSPVVRKLDRANHMKLYPVDNTIGFANTYPLD